MCKELICKQEYLVWHSVHIYACVQHVNSLTADLSAHKPIENNSSAPVWSVHTKHPHISSALDVCSALTFALAVKACFSLKTHFVRPSVIFISQDSLCPKVQEIRRGCSLSLHCLLLYLRSYLSINQSLFCSPSLLLFNRGDIWNHNRNNCSLLWSLCEGIGPKSNLCSAHLLQNLPSAPLPPLLVWAFVEDRSRRRGGGDYIRGEVSANGLLFTPVNLLAGG